MVFENEWGDSQQKNQGIITDALGIVRPEDSGVVRVVTKAPGQMTVFKPADGKHWSLAFARWLYENQQLQFGQYANITDAMRQLTEACFAGLKPHSGFVITFLAAEQAAVYLKKEGQ